MKNLMTVAVILCLAGCGGANDSASSNSSGDNFNATVGSQSFEASVRCEDFDSVGDDLWEFSVYNGKEPGDVNIQGLFGSGANREITLTIRETTNDGFQEISTQIEDYAVSASGISGSGVADRLVKENSGGKRIDTDVPISFEVMCN